MLAAATIAFLKQLAKNNNKVWFDENRDKYLAAKEDFEQLVTKVLEDLTKLDPEFSGMKAKDCIYRIFRDVRFGKDKTPYKSHFGAYFNKAGKKSNDPGFYLHIEPGGGNFAGGGMWQPEAPLLKAVRQEIDYNFDEFTKIITDKKFKKLFGEVKGETVKTLPKDYTGDNPAIEYLKHKSFIVSHNLPDDALTSKTLAKQIAEVFTTMQPFIGFLGKAGG